MAPQIQSHPPCPHLPPAAADMSHRCLSSLQTETADFYITAQRYGNYLWQQGYAGRAVLVITRSLYANLPADTTAYREWPLPYRALYWIFENHSSDEFPGNPRISFQHQATRIRGDRRALRRARAWAVWALVRQARPGLCGDSDHSIREPTYKEIKVMLENLGHPGEATVWEESFNQSPK